MTVKLFRHIRTTPQLTFKDLYWTLIPLALWITLIYARPFFIHPRCSTDSTNPAASLQSCTPEKVLPIDQPALQLNNSQADAFSYATQNLSGFLSMAVPIVWNASLVVSGTGNLPWFFAQLGTDLCLLLQASALNGALGESVRLLSQRPRPFIYANLAREGANPSHYISFYSGHTSFAALAMTLLVLLLFSRKAPAWLLFIFIAGGQSLILMTAVFRVLAGRHFITDVVVGALAGSTIAWAVWRGHLSSRKKIKV